MSTYSGFCCLIVMSLLNSILGHPKEVPIAKLEEEFKSILIEDEHLDKAYKLIRDMFVFTNKRLILINKQGITGSKVEYQSIPYGSITRFSKESAGLLDLDADLKIWIRGDSRPFEQHFGKDDNINEVYRVLSKYVL